LWEENQHLKKKVNGLGVALVREKSKSAMEKKILAKAQQNVEVQLSS
jgi:hypothetical protein